MKGKTVVLGVTGSIAAYKAVEIARGLIKKELRVKVVMTEAATQFITPLTFETITQNKVLTSIFGKEAAKIPYLALNREADLILVAPATTTLLAKAAHGFADDLLAALLLSTTSPVILAPAMHQEMYLNPATQENLEYLKKRGFLTIGPEKGELAREGVGIGRLAEVSRIVKVVLEELERQEDLKEKKVLITAGGTQESLDPIRFLSNRSSGKMGYALAREASRRGAAVTLVSGPTNLFPPLSVKLISVETALQMREAIINQFSKIDALIMAAAVSDFRPKTFRSQKIKKSKKLTLELEENPDILAELGKLKEVKSPAYAAPSSAAGGLWRVGDKASAGKQKSKVKRVKGQLPITNYQLPILVGFAAETENLVKRTQGKLKDKNLDLIVGTPISNKESGFGKDNIEFILMGENGKITKFPLMSKREAAHRIIDKVARLLKKPNNP